MLWRLDSGKARRKNACADRCGKVGLGDSTRQFSTRSVIRQDKGIDCQQPSEDTFDERAHRCGKWALRSNWRATIVRIAADQPATMLYSHGTTLLKGNTIARSSAIFSGDLVQTNSDSVANINATGSSVLVLNESLVQYEGSTLKLEHGGVSVSTSKLLATRAGGVTVSPASGAGTEFEVRGVHGRVQIAARTGDVTISHEKGTTTLAQGSSLLETTLSRTTRKRTAG
jgi:hypothetical protein